MLIPLSSVLLLPTLLPSHGLEAPEAELAPAVLISNLRRDLELNQAEFGATLSGRVEWAVFDEPAHRAALHEELVQSLSASVASDGPGDVLARTYFAEVLERFESGTFDGSLASAARHPDVRHWDETLWLDGPRVDVLESVDVGRDHPPVLVETTNDGRLQLRREEQRGETLYQELRLHEFGEDTRPTTVTLLLEATTRLEALLGLVPTSVEVGEATAFDLSLPTALVGRWRESAPSDTAFVPTVATLELARAGGVTELEVEYRARGSKALLFREALGLDTEGRPTTLRLDYFALGQSSDPVIAARLDLTPFELGPSSRPGPFEAVDLTHELVDARGGAARQVVLSGADVQNETAARLVGPWRAQALLGDRAEEDLQGWSVPVPLEDDTRVLRRYAREELTQGPLHLLLTRPTDAAVEIVDVQASCDCFELRVERDAQTGQPVLIARLRQGYEPADRVSVNLTWTGSEADHAIAFTRLELTRDDRASESELLYGLLQTAREDERVQQRYPLIGLLGQQAFELSSSEILVTATGDLTARPLSWVEDDSGVAELELEYGRLDRSRYGALEARVELRRRSDGSLLGAFAVLGTWVPHDLELGPDESLRLVPGPEMEIHTGPRLDLEQGRIEGLATEHWSVDARGRLVVGAGAPAGAFRWTDEVRTVELRVR